MKRLFALIVFISFLTSLYGQVPGINLLTFSQGYTTPVDIKSCGDSRLFIVQQNGYIFICDSLGNRNPIPFLDIHTEIMQSSERGLLGLAFHPDYVNNGYFFIYYTSVDSGKITISRFSVDSLNADLADPQSEMILIQVNHFEFSNHNGGGLIFGPDGYLYAGTGDGGSFGDPFNNGQNGKSRLGKLLRLDVNGALPYSIPQGNPFVGDTAFYPEIYAYGLRNPWRYSFDHLTGDLWIGDVGQDTWEEIDFAQYPDTGGQNYGWDCYEGFYPYSPSDCADTSGLTFPVYNYKHLSGNCSVTGGYVYRGAQYAAMYGKYFFIDYCSGQLMETHRKDPYTWVTNLLGDFSNSDYSSFGEDRYGELYIAGVGDGKIYRLGDSSCKPVAQILVNDSGNLLLESVACGNYELDAGTGKGLTYQWQFNGNAIPGATAASYFAADTGIYTVTVTNTNGCSNTSSPVIVTYSFMAGFGGLQPEYCQLATPDTLTGDPAGGIFEGDGISQNIFNPAVAGIGAHTITYTYVNDLGCSSSQSQTTSVIICTGIDAPGEQNEMDIYPNPNEGIFTISIKNQVNQLMELNIINLEGQIFATVSLPVSNTGIFIENFSSLVDGIYLLRLKKGNEFTYHKLIIEKHH